MLKNIIWFPLLFLLISLSGSAFSRDIKDLIPADEIKQYENIKSIKMTGQVQMGNLQGKVEEVYMYPSSIYVMMDLGIMKITQGFNGETAWMIDQNGQVIELTGHDKSQVINAAYMVSMSFLFNDRMPGAVKYLKDTIIENTNYAGFSFYPEGGDSVRAYINIETGNPDISVEYMDELAIWSYSSDYREVDGVKMPFKTETKSALPQLNMTLDFTEVSINSEIEPDIFELLHEEEIDYIFPDADSVIVEMEMVDGHIFVKARVNGKEKRSFILDSGASVNVIDRKYADEAGIEASGDLASKGVTGYGSTSLANIDTISIGGVKLLNQVVGIIDLGAIRSKSPDTFGGLLGYDFLARFPVEVDYANNRLIIYNPDKFIPPDVEPITFDFYMKIPSFTAEYSGVPGTFIMDFGNPFGLMIHKPFVEKYGLDSTFSDKEELKWGIGGVGGGAPATAAVGKNLVFGGVRIDEIRLVVANAGGGLTESSQIAGNIGNLLLEKFRVLVDYAHNHIYILPSVN